MKRLIVKSKCSKFIEVEDNVQKMVEIARYPRAKNAGQPDCDMFTGHRFESDTTSDQTFPRGYHDGQGPQQSRRDSDVQGVSTLMLAMTRPGIQNLTSAYYIYKLPWDQSIFDYVSLDNVNQRGTGLAAQAASTWSLYKTRTMMPKATQLEISTKFIAFQGKSLVLTRREKFRARCGAMHYDEDERELTR